MAAVAPKTTGGHDLGTSDLRWGTVYTGSMNASGDVTISGNLNIVGNASEINVDNLTVDEPLIKLANGNTSDTLDSGIFAQYGEDGSNKYSVLYRDATDGKWKLATGLTNEPTPGQDINLAGLEDTTFVVTNLEADALVSTSGTNNDLTLTPDGTGNLILSSDLVVVGEGDAAGTVTSSGAQSLVLQTNSGTNSGSITLAAGENGNIAITPNGTGEVDISKVDIDGGTIDGATIATSDVTVGAGKTLDVSAGTLTLADDQISGDKVNGGTIGSVTISQLAGAMDANSQAITNVNIDSGNIDGAAIGANSHSSGKFTSLQATGNFLLSGNLDMEGGGTITLDADDNSALVIKDDNTSILVVDTSAPDAGLDIFGRLRVTKGVEYDVANLTSNTSLDASHHVVTVGTDVAITLPAAASHDGREFIIIVTGTGVTIDHANGTDPVYLDGMDKVSGGTYGPSQHDSYRAISSGSAWYLIKG